MNRDQIEELEQSGAYIERMYHTLASYESSDYKDFLEDLSSDENFKNVTEKITEDIVDEYYKDGELYQMLIDYSLYGYIAEIRMPERANFRFNDKGEFKSCSVHPGIMRSEYVFGFTIDELVEKSVKIGNDHKKEMENEARKEQGIVLTPE